MSKFMIKQSFVQGKVNGQNMNMISVNHCNFQYFICTPLQYIMLKLRNAFFADAFFNSPF